jgi:hypothetical protein
MGMNEVYLAIFADLDDITCTTVAGKATSPRSFMKQMHRNTAIYKLLYHIRGTFTAWHQYMKVVPHFL